MAKVLTGLPKIGTVHWIRLKKLLMLGTMIENRFNYGKKIYKKQPWTKAGHNL